MLSIYFFPPFSMNINTFNTNSVTSDVIEWKKRNTFYLSKKEKKYM